MRVPRLQGRVALQVQLLPYLLSLLSCYTWCYLKTRDCERSQPSLIYRWASVLYTLTAQRDGGRVNRRTQHYDYQTSTLPTP